MVNVEFKQDIAFYSNLLNPGSLCFDVGANIGEKSEILLKSGANVVAFEPQPHCVKEIESRCSPYRDRLRICQVALGAKVGEAQLYSGEYDCLSSFWPNWANFTSSIKVPVITLDHAIAQFGKPSYCKIDVEGWELEVLKGLTQPIPLISIEYHLGKREIDITRDSLVYLSQFGELYINMTTEQSLTFDLPEWVSLKKFLELFPSKFQDHDEYSYGYEYRYGDIFIYIS